MADDFDKELDALDEAAGKWVKAAALCGELGMCIRSGGDFDVRVIAEFGREKEQAAMLRAAADRLDVPADRTLN